jgi:hypothetical protein
MDRQIVRTTAMNLKRCYICGEPLNPEIFPSKEPGYYTIDETDTLRRLCTGCHETIGFKCALISETFPRIVLMIAPDDLSKIAPELVPDNQIYVLSEKDMGVIAKRIKKLQDESETDS